MTGEAKEALNISLRFLARRARSRKELEKKLREKGVAENALSEVMRRLIELGYVDDEKYARSLAERYRIGRPSGRARLAFELKKRGISSDLCGEILEDYTQEQERDAAEELARRKWKLLSRADPAKRRKKIFDFLSRRGFDYETAEQALRKVSAENRESDSNDDDFQN